MNPYIVLGSAVVGFLVGMTGAGGGALMTPMLILLFAVKPSTAISSDLVAAVVIIAPKLVSVIPSKSVSAMTPKSLSAFKRITHLPFASNEVATSDEP